LVQNEGLDPIGEIQTRMVIVYNGICASTSVGYPILKWDLTMKASYH
jgi:hypothetical protein